MSPVVTAESTATVADGGPTLDSVMRAHPGLSVTDALEILARKTGSAADKALEHHGREGKRIYTEEPTDRKGAVMTASTNRLYTFEPRRQQCTDCVGQTCILMHLVLLRGGASV